MIVTIMKTDKVVVKDGVTHTEIDTSDLPESVHAIQWNGSSGDVEHVDVSKLPNEIVHVRNETITSFTPYQKYVDACNDGNKA
jgi:hypothetical protein